jgi:hypothetical protein
MGFFGYDENTEAFLEEHFGIIQIRPVRELREINYGLLDQY